MSVGRDKLRRLRSDLKAQGFVAELIPVQQAIIAEAEAMGCSTDLANAHNYLSAILLRLGRLEEAEAAARAALTAYAGVATPNAEVIACFEFVLAHTMALQGRFDGAVEAAENACRHYAAFHSPLDDFLTARMNDLAALRRAEIPPPLEW